MSSGRHPTLQAFVPQEQCSLSGIDNERGGGEVFQEEERIQKIRGLRG
jgi:hypothetical protein